MAAAENKDIFAWNTANADIRPHDPSVYDGDIAPKAHDLGGAAHNADTLAHLNDKVSDATLDDSGDPRDPNAHADGHTDGVTDQIADAAVFAAKTVTAHGSAQIDTAQKKFGTGSLENERATGDYLSVPTDADFDWRSGDWTMECWIRPESTDQNQGFLTIGDANFESIMLYWNESGNGALTAICSTDGSNWIKVSGGALIVDTWYHAALVRDGNTLRLFLDGTEVDTGAAVGALHLNDYGVKLGIFYNADTNGCFDGWLDEARFSKGIARYTAGFTPPTVAFVTDQYTRLLLHCDGIDTSTSFPDVPGAGYSGFLSAIAQTIAGVKTFNALINALGGITNSAAELLINFDAAQDAGFFGGAASGETPNLKVSGFFAADALRAVTQGIVAADTYGWTGASKYAFDGDVGIGTNSPDEALHVKGAGLTRIKIESTGNDPQLQLTDAVGSWFIFKQGTSLVFHDGAAVQHSFAGNGNAVHQGIIQTAGAGDNYFVGNLGIGVAVPLAKLDVVGTTRLGDSATNYFAASATGDTHHVGSAGMPYGEIWVLGNAVATAIAGAGTFVQFLGFANNGSSNNTTPDHTNDHITITIAGDYLCVCSFHIESIGAGAADTVSIEVRKNNGTVVYSNLHAHRKLAGGGGDIGSVSISGILPNLAVSDTIEVWLTNDSNATNILVADANLTITQIGGAG